MIVLTPLLYFLIFSTNKSKSYITQPTENTNGTEAYFLSSNGNPKESNSYSGAAGEHRDETQSYIRLHNGYTDGKKINKANRKANPPYRIIGDILYTKETWESKKNASTQGRASLIKDNYLWPKQENGDVLVPYEIDTKGFEGIDTSFIVNGFKAWEDGTCIKVVPWESVTNLFPVGNTRLFVINKPFTCNSYLGRARYLKRQAITLGEGCWKDSIASHEFGHALGLDHEHQRIDRDEYLMVFKMNIKGNHDEDFKRGNDRVFGVPYNYLSVMHYPYNSFSKSKETNMPTMLPRDPTLQYLLMEKHGVSHYDKLVLNYGYGCLETWRKKCTTRNYCQNYGYIGPNCTCICPPGAHGASCEKLLFHPLPAYPPSPCGGHITETGIYSSVKSNKNLICVWWVRPPNCHFAVVTITEFKVSKNNSLDHPCFNENFSAKTASLYEPDDGIKCGTEIRPGTSFIGKPDLVLDYQSKLKSKVRQGHITFSVVFKKYPVCEPKYRSSITCPYIKNEDGSVILRSPLSMASKECKYQIKFPGAEQVRIATRKFNVNSSGKLCRNAFLYIKIASGQEIRQCNVEYFNHLFHGNEVFIHYKNDFGYGSGEFEIVLHPIEG